MWMSIVMGCMVLWWRSSRRFSGWWRCNLVQRFRLCQLFLLFFQQFFWNSHWSSLGIEHEFPHFLSKHSSLLFAQKAGHVDLRLARIHFWCGPVFRSCRQKQIHSCQSHNVIFKSQYFVYFILNPLCQDGSIQDGEVDSRVERFGEFRCLECLR